jgi:aspartate kinase
MKIVVQKYGGTSVTTHESRAVIAQNAMALKEQGFHPIIVVSAIGRNGDPYATDTLINFFKSANERYSPKNLDFLLNCGEMISAAIVANTIESFGAKAVAMTGHQAGMVTDIHFGNANVTHVKPKQILKQLEDDVIVVITGFQGMTSDGELTTLGRGGSDTTAAILGVELDAEYIEIYTDVDGVMTADPRIVEGAQVLQNISYEACYQMAVDGAKVVDHKAIDIAKRGNKPLIIKNTFSKSKGTFIGREEDLDEEDRARAVTAVASKNDITQVLVFSSSDDPISRQLLSELEIHEISIDLINFFEDRKIFTVPSNQANEMVSILEKLRLNYKIMSECSKITVVGHNIHGAPGVMKRLVFALAREGIEILQSSDSYSTICCLIKSEHAPLAVKVLHAEFGLDSNFEATR